MTDFQDFCFQKHLHELVDLHAKILTKSNNFFYKIYILIENCKKSRFYKKAKTQNAIFLQGPDRWDFKNTPK